MWVNPPSLCPCVRNIWTAPTGVPQGSILGPELYNYNSNDLFLFILLFVANYADDNFPFCTKDTIPGVIDNLEII